MVVYHPSGQIVSETKLCSAVSVGIECGLAIPASVSMRAVPNDPPLDSRSREFQIRHDLGEEPPAKDVDLCAPALRALFRLFALNILAYPGPSFVVTLLATEALAHRWRGPQVHLVSLIVGVGTTVDCLQLWAEELLFPKPESRLLLDV